MIDSFHGDGKTIFLSNFSRYCAEYEGDVYPTSEHAYQAAKSMDHSFRRKVQNMKTPREAKDAGASIPNMREDWDLVKFGVMYSILLDKFTRSMKARGKLIATGEQDLIEGNTWHDNYWGDCRCDQCKNIEGQNLLGYILEDIRFRIKTIRIP